MGKLVVVAMTSVDGSYEGPAGAGAMLPLGVDDGFNAYNAEIVERGARVVIGHSSFEDFSSYWPDREAAGDASEAEERFARAYNPLPKTVVSYDGGSVEVPRVWADNLRVVSDDLAGEVARDKDQAGDGDVLVWSSRSVWTRLLQVGPVDELHLVAGTGVAGSGTPVFPEGVAVELVPLETRILPDSLCVLTTYAVRGAETS
jgi:dihydrofolate reductase